MICACVCHVIAAASSKMPKRKCSKSNEDKSSCCTNSEGESETEDYSRVVLVTNRGNAREKVGNSSSAGSKKFCKSGSKNKHVPKE